MHHSNSLQSSGVESPSMIRRDRQNNGAGYVRGSTGREGRSHFDQSQHSFSAILSEKFNQQRHLTSVTATLKLTLAPMLMATSERYAQTHAQAHVELRTRQVHFCANTQANCDVSSAQRG
jgi:hypothetical protein